MRIDSDEDWKGIAAHWELEPGVTNLNHGSFGPPPKCVREVRQDWVDRMDREPMDFFVRQVEKAQRQARAKLAAFVGTSEGNLAPVDNATYGMNVVANSFPLRRGDEVLINNHEYGAVFRIWERACEAVGAKLVNVKLPSQFRSKDEIVEPIVAAMTPSTRLLIVSHITSPTAVHFPVESLIGHCRQRDIAVCIDGPHAIAQLPLHLGTLDCDFYTASCHKWLCAAFGSGFLYVHPRWHANIKPPILSWGRLLPAMPESWDEQFLWRGTSNMSAFLTLPAAIDFLEGIGLEAFRSRTHWLARYARRRLESLFQVESAFPDDPRWYGCMSLVRLPDRDWSTLQQDLWNEHRIEVPIIPFADRWFVRVSCHLHTMTSHIDRLIDALKGI